MNTPNKTYEKHEARGIRFLVILFSVISGCTGGALFHHIGVGVLIGIVVFALLLPKFLHPNMSY